MHPEHPRILVIDDESNNFEVLSLLLQKQGYDVLFALNGAQGIERAAADQPDLILLDVVMPEMDGFETCRQLKASDRTRDIPVIFMTALSDTQEKIKGFESGAVDYVTKPIDSKEVLVRVNTQLALRSVYKDLHTEIQGLSAQKVAITRQLEELRTNLSYLLPHELRTPLNAILGFSRLLMTLDPAQCAEPDFFLPMRTAMYNSAVRLQRLVENYLLYADLQLMAENPEKLKRKMWQSDTPVQTKPFLSYFAASKVEQAGRNEDVQVDLVDARIRIAEKSLQKIIDELLDNALKFSERGTPIKIVSEKNSGQWVLRVIDHGRGMKSEQIARVGAFMQFDRRYYEQQGSGLGLVLVQLLAQINGGKLSIESEPGQGTTVSVMFNV